MSIERLSTLDRFMLRVDRTWPQDIGALAMLDGTPLFDRDGGFRLEVARDAIEARLHLVPAFRRVIHVPRRGLGPPLWVDARQFDAAQHVRAVALEPPAGEAELLAAVEHLRRRQLDRSRPMWEMWFLTGLPENQIGLFVKLSHSIADGMAAMITLVALLDTEPDARIPEAPPWQPIPVPKAAALFADNGQAQVARVRRAFATLARPWTAVRQARVAWPAIRELVADEPATRTSLDRMVGPARHMALVRCNVRTIRAIGHANKATVNDILLATITGGLRALLLHRGEPVEGTTIRIYVPVSLRRRLRGPQQGNLIAQMVVPLDLGESNPLSRLRSIALETTSRKSRFRTSLGTLMHGGAIVRRLMIALIVRQRVNVMSASIPGPKRPLYLAGARVLEVFPILPLVANEPLGVGAISYAGTLNVGITADRDAFPDLDVFVHGVRDTVDRLAANVRVEPDPSRGNTRV